LRATRARVGTHANLVESDDFIAPAAAILGCYLCAPSGDRCRHRLERCGHWSGATLAQLLLMRALLAPMLALLGAMPPLR